MKGFDAAQRAYDAMTPDERCVNECPECDALLSELSDGTWSCDECGYQISEPDCEIIGEG